MGRMSEELDLACRASPKGFIRVVITLKESCQDVTPQQLGIDAAPIEGIPGMFAGSLPGDSILQLCQRDEVLEVTEDYEVST